MAHDDSTGKKGDDSRQAHKLAKQIGQITIEQDQGGLFYWMFVDGLVYFEKIAESKTTHSSKSYTEEEQIAEIKTHLPYNFDSKLEFYHT